MRLVSTCVELKSEVLNVRSGQSESLNLAEFPVHWFSGDQLSETGECGVNTLGSVPLSHVGDHARLLT